MTSSTEKSSSSSEASEDSYDPHEHRVSIRPTNNFETLVHLVKCCLGTGILAIPQAFSRVGMVTGIIGTVVVGVMLTHCLQLLMKMQYRVCKEEKVPQLTYPQCLRSAMEAGPTAMQVLAKPLARSVNLLLILYQLGVCCVYIVFLADSMKKMIDPAVSLTVTVHMLILLLPLVALNLIPNLKILAPFSLLANILTLIGIGIIIYFLVTNLKGTADPTFRYFGSAIEVPLFFGTMLFALTSVPVVVALERNMKTPKSYTKFFGVLNTGMTFIVILYSIVGALGYMYCVSDCSDSITLDLPVGIGGFIVQIMMCIAIFISYGLQCYVPVEVILQNYVLPSLENKNASKKQTIMAEYAIRVGLCLLTMITAMLVPRLGLIISLFGALCLSALGMIFPPLMEICLLYPDEYGPGNFYLLKDMFLCFFGIVGLVVGTYSSIAAIIRSFY